ncbi:MAG: hypothetical protein M0Q22_14695 [Sulfuritalea sp.]|jgi:hypothetical protein|nr:hypothetical protein [Sulfuritalea sp.]
MAEIDTASIQLPMLTKQEGMKQGTELRIVAPSPAVSDLMEFYSIARSFGDPLAIPARDAA